MIGFFNHGTQGTGNREPTVICAPVVIWKRAVGDVKILNPECHACITGLRGDQQQLKPFWFDGALLPNNTS